MATAPGLNYYVRSVEWTMRHVSQFYDVLWQQRAASRVYAELYTVVSSVDFCSYEHLPAPQVLPCMRGAGVPCIGGNVAFNLALELMETHPGVLMRLAGIQRHWAWLELFELLVKARFRLHHDQTGQHVLRATLYSNGSVDVTYRQRLRVATQPRPAEEGCIAWYSFSLDE